MRLLILLKNHCFSLCFLSLVFSSLVGLSPSQGAEPSAPEPENVLPHWSSHVHSATFETELLLANSGLQDGFTVLSANPSPSIRANFFVPYHTEVSENLPEDTLFRLPSNLHLLEVVGNSLPEDASFQIIPNLRGGGLMVNLSLCSTEAPSENCTIGHFSTLPLASATAQSDLAAHQSIGYPITLAPSIQAHFREYRDGPIPYASLMWEQDNQFYRIQFPAAERQNMLYMALEMINGDPLYPSSARENRALPDGHNTGSEPTIEIISPEPDQTSLAAANTPRDPINLDTLYISPSSLFSPEEMQGWLAQIQVNNSSPSIQDLADRITQEYINRGYITSMAGILNRDDLPPGFESGLGIQEGRLTAIAVIDHEGNALQEIGDYIRSRLTLVSGPPLNLDQLEEKLRLLRLNPLFDNIEATLSSPDSGEEPRGNILTIRVREANPLIYTFSVNNDSAPSIGAEQFELGFTYLNVSGYGDSLSANYSRSFAGGLDYIETAYQVPLSPTDTTLRLSGAWISTNVVEEPFNQLNVSGNTNRYAAWLRQPLIRSPQEELALSLGFTHTSGQTFLFDRLPTPFGFGPDINGFSRTSVVSFAQDYVLRSPDGAWAFTSQFNLGTGLLDATQNSPPVPDGQFFSWQGLAQRVQRLGLDHLLIASFNVQLTPDSLLPSESFTIGGVSSVRGYRQGARSGDNGLRFSLEDRITIERDGAGRPVLVLTPFIDLGSVWNHPDNPNVITGQTFLMGSGLGMTLQNIEGLAGVSFRLNYGIPIINMSDRGNNLQDAGFYFGVDYNSAPNR